MHQVGAWVSNVSKVMTEVLSGITEENEKSKKDELDVDDDLPVEEKIQKYLNSDMILHRLYLVREIVEYAEDIGYDRTCSSILPFLDQIKKDVEPVIRQAFVEQIPELSSIILTNKNGMQVLLSTLLPIIEELIGDMNTQVRTSAVSSLISIAKRDMSTSQVAENIFPILSSLTSDTGTEQMRVEVARIIHQLSDKMERTDCVEFALPMLLRLSKDDFRVRKAVAQGIGAVSKVVGPTATTEVMLPLYSQLSDDEVWGVRKACAEALVSLSSAVTPSERQEVLLPLFEQFVGDKSRWVKSEAYQNLGHFISCFDADKVPPVLLEYYNGMVEVKNGKYYDSELVVHCAFDFPAVIQTIGGNRWEEVQATFFSLAKDLQWKVRRPLAFSLSVIAYIVGNNITEEYLLPTFEAFLKDLDEVKVGVIKNLYSFLSVLSPEKRISYIKVVADVVNETSNWRFRKLVAKQISKISSLFSVEIVNKWFVPISIQLVQDPVFEVRNAAFSQVGSIIQIISSNPDMVKDYVETVEAFSSTFPDSSFIDRQMFVSVCSHSASQVPPEIFEQNFLPRVLMLAEDSVPNVRLAVCEALNKILDIEKYQNNVEVIAQLKYLAKDKDTDVSYFSSQILHKLRITNGKDKQVSSEEKATKQILHTL